MSVKKLLKKAKQKASIISASCLTNVGILAVIAEEFAGLQGSVNTQAIELLGQGDTNLSDSIKESKNRLVDLDKGSFKIFYENIKTNPKNTVMLLTKAIIRGKDAVRDTCAPLVDVAGNIAGSIPVHMIEAVGVAAVSYIGCKIIKSIYDGIGVVEDKKQEEGKKGIGVLAKIYKKKELSSSTGARGPPEDASIVDSKPATKRMML